MSRVVFLNHSASLSGAELFLAGVLERTTRIDPVVILFEDGPLHERLTTAGVPVMVRPLPRSLVTVPADQRGLPLDVAALRSLGAMPRWFAHVRAVVAQQRAPTVYTNSAKAHVFGVPLGRSLRRRTVMHVHNAVTGDTYSSANRVALKVAAGSATSVIVNSRATGGSLPSQVARRAELLYCPTVVGPALPPPPPSREVLSVALVGRVTAWKGQRLAVQALARLLTATGPGTAELHVYGAALFPGDADYENEVRALAESLGVTAAVHWHGHVDDVPSAMRRHDVVIHTTMIPEPMGQVILEAMAAGRPLVAADSGGPLELVQHETTGLLYRTGDVESLVDALVTLAKDRSLRARLSEAAWQHVQQFSYEALLPEWERLVLGEPSSSATKEGSA